MTWSARVSNRKALGRGKAGEIKYGIRIEMARDGEQPVRHRVTLLSDCMGRVAISELREALQALAAGMTRFENGQTEESNEEDRKEKGRQEVLTGQD